MSHVTTLSEFIINRQGDFPYATGELSRLLTAVRLAAKIVNREVGKAGLAEHILGSVGTENVQGEEQQKLDVFADNVFINAFKNQIEVCGIGSEELDDYIGTDAGLNPNGKYIILMDPLDGSSNIDVNVSIGTIFSIYRRVSEVGSPVTAADFLQAGRKQVAAGYVLYGSSTMLVYSTGNGVNGFTLDPSIGVFCLSHPDMKTKADGKIVSINEQNYHQFSPGVKQYVDYCKEEDEASNRPYTARYIGSLVADFHRNLLKGGIYMYPATNKTPKGKLRLLYEANPLAFLVEQSGGKATNGTQDILDVNPTELHQRVPLFIGSANMVDKLQAFISTEKAAV